MTADTPLDRLAEAYDIEPGYTDIWQRRHQVDAETKHALLAAMGVPCESEAEVEASLATVDKEAFERALPAVIVRRQGEQIDLPIAVDIDQGRRLSWSVQTENGDRIKGDVSIDDLPVIDRNTALGRQHVRLTLPLADLPPGYHRCTVALDSSAETEIIVAPKRAYWPEALDRKGGLVGVTAPLYGLRSGRNAGLGDFADLADIAKMLAPLGASFVGINPVHALFPSQPTRISPYAPSSRSFLNVLMIALDRVPELAGSPGAQAILARAESEALLSALRASDLVDYPKVTALKLTVLEAFFATFLALPQTSPRRQHFRTFVEAGGQALERHARFEALSEHFIHENAALTDWHDWPTAYQTPDSEAVQAFAEEHADRVTFYGYLQWLAATQLEQAQNQATAAGGGGVIGLYLDLAVGVASDGAEAWSDQDVLVNGVRIGAPPDDFNPDGQNWGLLPLSPKALRTRGYRPFIDLLRHSMRHAGALRIDHVIGLARSFWLPEDRNLPGAYIRYPMRDLLGLVALESKRQRSVVIGEDLGTVPRDLRAALDEHGLLGCRLLYFERDEKDACRPSSAYPKASIASIGTHDLPTLKGFWQGRDIDWRQRLSLYPDQEKALADRCERERLKAELLHLLDTEGLLPDAIDPLRPPQSLPWSLVDAFHRFLSRTPAALKAIQLEDAAGAVEQANLPGTIDEHPNWRRKISVPLEDLASEQGLLVLLCLFQKTPLGIETAPPTA